MQTTNIAYDLSVFEQKQEKPAVKVLQNERPHGRVMGMAPIKLLFLSVIIASVTTMFIYCQVVLTELTEQINSQRIYLDELIGETTRLEVNLESKVSLGKIEEYAQENLGLVKAQKYQIEYVLLSNEDVVKVNDAADNLPVRVYAWVNDLVEEVLAYISG